MDIRAIAIDVDGVLTDGTVLIDADGREAKRISFADIMGISIGRRGGLLFALVSGESGTTLDHIAAKLGIDEVYRACTDKAAAVRQLADRHHLALTQIAFIGDDINDVAAMEICGLAAAPPDAQPIVLARADVVTSRRAGSGALRELIEHVLSPERAGSPST